MGLPLKLPWDKAQTLWERQIDPIITFPPNKGLLLSNLVIKTGTNVINHKLARKQQGYIITDQTTSASIYRSADFNDLTLTLTSSAPSVVSLWVF